LKDCKKILYDSVLEISQLTEAKKHNATAAASLLLLPSISPFLFARRLDPGLQLHG